MNTIFPARARVAVLLLAALCLLTSCASLTPSAGNGIVIDGDTQQPMAGVYVGLYFWSYSPSSIPWTPSRQGCGPEFYAVSDANGKFVIPAGALEPRTEFSLQRVNHSLIGFAYKRGYVDEVRITGTQARGSQPGKLEPLAVKVVMRKDTRTLFEHKEWLSANTMAGCRCSEIHKAMLSEIREIEPEANRQERIRLNGGKPLAPGQLVLPFPPGPYPRRTCE